MTAFAIRGVGARSVSWLGFMRGSKTGQSFCSLLSKISCPRKKRTEYYSFILNQKNKWEIYSSLDILGAKCFTLPECMLAVSRLSHPAPSMVVTRGVAQMKPWKLEHPLPVAGSIKKLEFCVLSRLTAVIDSASHSSPKASSGPLSTPVHLEDCSTSRGRKAQPVNFFHTVSTHISFDARTVVADVADLPMDFQTAPKTDSFMLPDFLFDIAPGLFTNGSPAQRAAAARSCKTVSSSSRISVFGIGGNQACYHGWFE